MLNIIAALDLKTNSVHTPSEEKAAISLSNFSSMMVDISCRLESWFPPSCTYLSNQKQPSCKKKHSPQKGHGEKRCETQGGGQKMAAMVG